MAKISRKELGQLMMVGFEGTTLPDFYYHWLKQGLGGIILFSRNFQNPEQLAKLTDEIQHAARPYPAFISIDQEGGRVARLKDPFTHFPSAKTLAQSFHETGSKDLIYQSARATALELAAMGIRLNFAPVLDVNSNPENPIIGDRAFSSDPQETFELAMEVMRGLLDGGVISCGKHFPGHGSTTKDSHLELPVVNKTLEEMQKEELIPFQKAIFQKIPMIMTAHVLYPFLDPENPATLSEKIIQDLLRYQLGYDGVVISDDLEMKAIAEKYSWREIVAKTMNAGVDLLLPCKSQSIQEEVFENLIDCVDAKEISSDRINQSLKRIKHLKNQYLKDVRPFPKEEWQKIIGSKDHQALAKNLNQFS